MRRLVAVPIALLLLAFTGLSAAANKPQRFPAQFPDHIGFSCPTFDGVITFPVNNEFVTIFSDTRAMITGRLVAKWTNPSTGAAVTANINGPGFFSLSPDGTEIDISTGLHGDGTGVFAGRIVETFYPDGSFTVRMVGHTLLDVCAALG